MPYVFVVADAAFVRYPYLAYPSNDDAGVFSWGLRWARQVDRRDDAQHGDQLSVRVLGVPANPTHDAVIAATVSELSAAAAEAGQGGIVGILMGHGGPMMHACTHPQRDGSRASCPIYWTAGDQLQLGNARFGVQLAPAGHLNVTELHLGVIRDMRTRHCSLPAELDAVAAIGTAFASHRLARVEFYSCELGAAGSRGLFLDNLDNLWGVRVAGLVGTVGLSARVLDHRVQGNVTLTVIPPTGPRSPGFVHDRPSEAWWYESTGVYERPIEMPSDRPRSTGCDVYL